MLQHQVLSSTCKRHTIALSVSRALCAAAIATATVSLAPGIAAAADVQQSASRQYTIEAGPLEAALTRFGRQSGLMISYAAADVAGKKSPGLHGSYLPAEALQRLLDGSNLRAIAQPNGGYSLQPESANTAASAASDVVSTLPAVTVTAVQQAETAFSPVIGYRARRASSATKTDTPLSETPQAVTVVTRDQMTDQGATTLQDALTYAAGVRSDAYGLDSRTDSALVRGAEATMYIDGLRQTNDWYTSGARPDPYTLERIEVLRGPAAMLYGQGSTGGVMNLVSKRPQEQFQGEIGVQIGNDNRKQIQADVTGPLTEDGQWLYRLVAVARDSDTQVDYVKDDRTLLMPTLTWKPSGVTTLTLQGLYQKDSSGSTSQFFPWSASQTYNPNGRVPTSRFIGEPDDRYDTERSTLGYLFEHQFNDSWTVRQNFRYARNKVDYFTRYADAFRPDHDPWYLDPVNQRVIGRYIDNSATEVRIATLDQHLEGKFSTGTVKHDLLAGLDMTRYQRDRKSSSGYDTIDVYAPVYGNSPDIPLTQEPQSVQRQIGLYLQDQMKIGQWIIAAGVRRDHVNNALEGSDDEKDDATTKRLGLMYLLQNGWSPYINYSESFTPVAGTNAYGERFKPLRGEQIEGGVKYMQADGNTQFTAAVWHIKEKNQSTVDPANPLNNIQVDATKNRGIELEWNGRLTRSVDLLAFYNYTDLDEKLTAVPRHQASVWGKWRFALGDIQGLSLGAGARYMSSFTDGDAPTTPSVTLFDAALAWDTPHWRYALNVRNLADKTYNSVCLSRGDCWYGARRTVVATATYRF
jgi:iron complex outermembrane receptor protein